jgi:hypothetical protein
MMWLALVAVRSVVVVVVLVVVVVVGVVVVSVCWVRIFLFLCV